MKKLVLVLSLAGALFMSGSALATDGPNHGKVSLEAGFDVTSAYYFRGIFQEDDDFIIQPYAGITFDLYEGEGLINSASLYLSTWNSVHTGPTGSGSGGPGSWYESDLTVGVSLGLPANLTQDIAYVYIGAPDPAGSIYAEEVTFTTAYDDSEGWNLQPYIMFAVEVDGASDGVGDGDDTYFEAGVSQEFTLVESETAPITVSVPVTVGLSVDDYYEFPTDETFGFLDVGIIFSMPLSSVPSDFGEWVLSAGVNFLFLGDSTEAANGGDDTEVIGTVGLSMSY